MVIHILTFISNDPTTVHKYMGIVPYAYIQVCMCVHLLAMIQIITTNKTIN